MFLELFLFFNLSLFFWKKNFSFFLIEHIFLLLCPLLYHPHLHLKLFLNLLSKKWTKPICNNMLSLGIYRESRTVWKIQSVALFKLFVHCATTCKISLKFEAVKLVTHNLYRLLFFSLLTSLKLPSPEETGVTQFTKSLN